MKISESSDGTIRVVEMDPTKAHVVILDDDCGIDPQFITLKDGLILMKRRGTKLEIVEGAHKPDQVFVQEKI